MRVLAAILLTLFCLTPQSAFASRSKVKKLAKKTGIPVELLESYGARRFFSRDVYKRRDFIKAIADKPNPKLLPLVTLIGTKETADEPIRRSSIRLYSHLGLLADRNDVKEHVFPAIKKALSYGAKRGQDQRWSMEELIRLSKWFEMDADLFELVKPIFEGDDFNLRSCAFQTMVFIRHEKLRSEYMVPACFNIYRAKKGYSLFDRRRAVQFLANERIKEIGPLLRDDMAGGKIPKLQIMAMDIFARWKDPSALPVVRGIDYTAVHELRRGAFKAMAAMKDPSCLNHLLKRIDSDHISMLTSSVEDLAYIGGDKVEKLLKTILAGKFYPPARVQLWQRRSKPETVLVEQRQLKLAAAMALLKLNNDAPVKWLETVIAGRVKEFDEGARKGVCKRVLAIRTPATTSLIQAILKLRGDQFKGLLKRAAIQAGERGLKACEADLKALNKDEKYKGHIQFHCAVSLFEIGSKGAFKRIVDFMKEYDDNIRKNDKTKFVLGTLQFDVNRWEGSEYIAAINKFNRTKNKRMLPLILEMLKPIPEKNAKSKKADKKKKKKKPGKRSGTTTRTRGKKAKIWKPEGPEPRYRVRNQFVRAKAVLVAGRLGGEMAAPVLKQAIVDHRAIVRSNAIRAIGEISGQYKLHVGATDQEEAEVREQAELWLEATMKKVAKAFAEEQAKIQAQDKEKGKDKKAGEKKEPKPKRPGTP